MAEIARIQTNKANTQNEADEARNAKISRAYANAKVDEDQTWWIGSAISDIESLVRDEIKNAINLGKYRVEIYLGKQSLITNHESAKFIVRRVYLGKAIEEIFNNLKAEGFGCELYFGWFDCLVVLVMKMLQPSRKYDIYAAMILEAPDYYKIEIHW